MKVLLAQRSGFCFGVRRAARIIADLTAAGQGPLCTLGPLIHNRQEVARLSDLGVRVCAGVEDCGRIPAVVRTHGIPRQEMERARALGLTLHDATCPHVRLPRRRLQTFGQAGRTVFLLGDPDHPEVRAQVTYAQGPIHVVPEASALPDLSPDTAVGVVAQTTLSQASYERILAAVRARFGDVIAEDTICEDARMRQEEVLALSRQVDCLIVVGGRESANTRRLASIAVKVLPATYQVETADELADLDLGGARVAGVASGASTPDWIIEAVVERLENI